MLDDGGGGTLVFVEGGGIRGGSWSAWRLRDVIAVVLEERTVPLEPEDFEARG